MHGPLAPPLVLSLNYVILLCILKHVCENCSINHIKNACENHMF
jgi:hypothetical protein